MMHPIRRIAILVGVSLVVAVAASAIVGAVVHLFCAALVAVQP